MTEGRVASSARRTASRSRRSTASQCTPGCDAGCCPPSRAKACTALPPAVSRSTRCPPANPVAPVTSGRPGPALPARSAVAVLFLVVLPERRILILDRPPPGLVLAVPLHRAREPLLELLARRPAERFELLRAQRVAAVVPGAVGDRLDERRGLADELEDPVREIDVLHLIAAADVVDLARNAALDEQVDGAAVVLDVQPVALVLSVTVERHGNVVDEVGDEERDDLLGKLVRPVVVRRPRDD